MYMVLSATDIRIALQFIACQNVRLQYISHMLYYTKGKIP